MTLYNSFMKFFEQKSVCSLSAKHVQAWKSKPLFEKPFEPPGFQDWFSRLVFKIGFQDCFKDWQLFSLHVDTVASFIKVYLRLKFILICSAQDVDLRVAPFVSIQTLIS